MEALITTLFTPMLDRAIEECGMVFHLKEDISNLQNSILLIKVVLQDAEMRQDTEDNIKQWLRQLDDIVFDARNVFDNFMLYTHGKIKFFKRFKLAGRIKDINARLEKAIKQKEILNLRPGETTRTVQARRVETGFLPDAQNLFVGRDEIMQSILDKILTNHDDICQVKFIPISGMGGIGKTTLAQSIYNDYSRLTEQDYPEKNRKWICVGEKEFDAKRIMKEILYESADYPIIVTTATLQEYVVKKLNANKGGRFLIVLDDVWCIKRDEWEIIWRSLARVEKGGVVIMTTRIKDVIANTGNMMQEELPRLSHSDCWKIFKKRAFEGREVSSLLEEFEEVGRKIVEKLNGLPLAVDVVGKSLLNELDLQTWRSFLDNQKLINLKEDIMPALKWSYDLLPSELKSCFAYCSLFPKDHRYKKEDLVNMWMAHDFIRCNQNQRPEDVGSDYLKKLLNASLLQPSGTFCVMHDMIHDLAKLVSNNQYFMIDDHNGELNMVPEGTRHLWINTNMHNIDELNYKRLLSLVGVTTKITCPFPGILNKLFAKLKFIRVVVLPRYDISEIPDSIGKLRHVRYLDLRGCGHLRSLPASIGQLHFLQTLMVPDDCSFPRSMGNLIHLRHLIGGEASVNTGVGKLTLLQELSCIRVDIGENIAELQHLDNLHGKLIIKGVRNIHSQEDAVNFKMQRKKHIRDLTFDEYYSNTDDKRNYFLEGEVLNALQPPPLLECLEINSCMGWKYPRWMNKKNLPKLNSFVLFDNRYWEVLPHLGEFDFLKSLCLASVPEVKKLGHEFYGRVEDEEMKVFFKSLINLEMDDFTGLKEWDGVKNKASLIFPCLQSLIINKCPLLKMIPFFQKTMMMKSLTKVRIRKCGSLSTLEMKGLVSLKTLNIAKCSKVVEVSLPNIPGIEILKLRDCPDLISLSFGLQGFSSLRSLVILNCPKLPSLIMESSESSTPSDSETPSFSSLKLEELEIDNMSAFSKLLQYNLSSLANIIIQPNSELTCFSMMEEENWKKLKSLRKLLICDCCNLVSLPSTMNRFTSLDGVVIRGCPQLLQLQDCEFPPSLKSFSLIECPHLLKTCEREIGIDWQKIKHIPELYMIEDESECFTTESGTRKPFYSIKMKNSWDRYYICPGDRLIYDLYSNE